MQTTISLFAYFLNANVVRRGNYVDYDHRVDAFTDVIYRRIVVPCSVHPSKFVSVKYCVFPSPNGDKALPGSRKDGIKRYCRKDEADGADFALRGQTMRMTVAAMGLVLALTLGSFSGSNAFADPNPQASADAQASAFDGLWTVTIICPVSDDGAKGYEYQFPARVTDGLIHGEHNAQNTAGWLTLDGPIASDGSSILLAKGLTGKPDYSVGRVATLTPYSYHVAAQFEAKHGKGTRKELRACSVDFAKN